MLNRFHSSRYPPTCYAATMWLSVIGTIALPHADASHQHGVMNISGLTAHLDWIYIQEHTTEAE